MSNDANNFIRITLVMIAFAAASMASDAQTAPTASVKRALTHNDFDSWRTIAAPLVSRDGKWLAYAVQPQDGDGELVMRDLTSNIDYRAGVGALPPPVTTPNEENPDAPPVPRAIRVLFTSDNRYLVATTFPTKADIAAARKAKKRADEMPKGGLLIIDLVRPAEVNRVANIKSLQVPSKGGAWLAYLKEEVKEPAKPAETKEAIKADENDADDDQAKKQTDQDQAGTEDAGEGGDEGEDIEDGEEEGDEEGGEVNPGKLCYIMLYDCYVGWPECFVHVLDTMVW